MPKIFTTNQIREWDAYTIRHEPIASIDLMERASKAFVDWFKEKFTPLQQVGVFCGTGNNGGDGLAIARLLSQAGYVVSVTIVKSGTAATADFQTNLERLPTSVARTIMTEEAGEESMSDGSVLIDAIFGTGLSRPVEGVYAKAVRCINDANSTVVSVDLPSGVQTDGPTSGLVVQADYTITFQAPKLPFFLPQQGEYVGEWVVVDIGLSKSYEKDTPSDYHFLTHEPVGKLLRRRKKFSHKGDFGRALLVVGSTGKMGAGILAARGALRAGAGLLTLHVPRHAIPIVQTAVPEAMAIPDRHEEYLTSPVDYSAFQIIGVGPGIGQAKETKLMLEQLLRTGKPLVLDADALNLLAGHRELLSLVPQGSILTPHPGEFARLVGPTKNDFDQLNQLRKFATELRCIVVLKGANTAIADQAGNIYFNTTGNPGMATGGSGDVLTGILTGLRAQQYSPLDSALLGVYAHGLAGDLAVQAQGWQSLMAGDLVSYLAAAFSRFAYK